MHLFNFAGLDFCPFGSQSEVFLRKSHKWSSTVDCQSVYKPTFRFYFKSFWCKFWWKSFPEIQQIPIYSLMRIDIALIVIYNLIFMASTLYLYNFLKAMTENNTALTIDAKGSFWNWKNMSPLNKINLTLNPFLWGEGIMPPLKG